MALPATAESALAQVAPEFYAQGSAVYTFWIDLATASIGATGWGTLYPTVVALLATHQWNRLIQSQASGPVASNSVSNGKTQVSISQSFVAAPVKSVDEWELSSTPWGRQFLAIRQTRAAFGPRLVVL
tara:strand:- start:377 stop:760 length:384 start_codon:yes stop_codon:yes gene_type:complete